MPASFGQVDHEARGTASSGRGEEAPRERHRDPSRARWFVSELLAVLLHETYSVVLVRVATHPMRVLVTRRKSQVTAVNEEALGEHDRPRTRFEDA